MTRSFVIVAALLGACSPQEQELHQDGPMPGYILPPETQDDLPALYEQISTQESCLNRNRTREGALCEMFHFAPCDSVTPSATPVPSVPEKCETAVRTRTGRTGAIQWCMIGPHVEPPPPSWPQTREEAELNSISVDRIGWCAGLSWMEGEAIGVSCEEAAERVRLFRDEISSGRLDVDARCYAVDPAEVLEACANHFCRQ